MTTLEIVWLAGGVLIFLAPMVAGYKDASDHDGMLMTFCIAIIWPFAIALAAAASIVWAVGIGVQKVYAAITHRMAAFWGME